METDLECMLGKFSSAVSQLFKNEKKTWVKKQDNVDIRRKSNSLR